MTAEELIKQHEGFNRKPYECTEGRLTIGYGRNLSDVGITVSEALMLFENDFRIARMWCETHVPSLRALCEPRQAALISMAFQMGGAGLLTFKKMLAAVKCENFSVAAGEMLLSRWAAQTPERANELAAMMNTGEWQRSADLRASVDDNKEG